MEQHLLPTDEISHVARAGFEVSIEHTGEIGHGIKC